MLTRTTNLKGLAIHATDGELGTVDQLYFDDETWAIRYFTVETGNWLSGRQVLISPMSVLRVDWQAKRLEVTLTRKQVEGGPGIAAHRPVWRQHEAEYLGYYGYPNYWDGPYLWGPSYYPGDLAAATPVSMPPTAAKAQINPADTHLRSTEAVTGHNIDTIDGEIGHVSGFIVDDQAWAIRYLEVATQNWWPGKKVLFSPGWVERVSWTDFKVHVALTKEAIEKAPAFDESMPILREYEDRLYFHYGRPPYWQDRAARDSSFSLTRV